MNSTRQELLGTFKRLFVKFTYLVRSDKKKLKNWRIARYAIKALRNSEETPALVEKFTKILKDFE
jgi:hypothetical protein